MEGKLNALRADLSKAQMENAALKELNMVQGRINLEQVGQIKRLVEENSALNDRAWGCGFCGKQFTLSNHAEAKAHDLVCKKSPLVQQNAAQAKQIKRLEAVSEAAEDFRDAVFLNATNIDEFRTRLEAALKEASDG